MIAPTMGSAEAAKEVAPKLRVIILQDGLGSPRASDAVDGWLTIEARIIRPGLVSDQPHSVEVYADVDGGPADETSSLRRANLFNVYAYISNDIGRAIATIRGPEH